MATENWIPSESSIKSLRNPVIPRPDVGFCYYLGGALKKGLKARKNIAVGTAHRIKKPFLKSAESATERNLDSNPTQTREGTRAV